MGCGGSKDGITMHIQLDAPKFIPVNGGHGTTAFAICEEADEKAIFQNAKVANQISLAMPPPLAMPAPLTLEQKVDKFRDKAKALPKPGVPDASNGQLPPPCAPLDAESLTTSLAKDLFELLLRPDCPSPAVSKRLCLRILLAAIDHLATGGPVVDVPLPTGSQRSVIVGDTHGQLQDVLTILLEYGLPSMSNRYVFNGDIADRGPNACEIFLLVLLYQLLVPGSLVVTRGNHEAADINERPASMGGGFLDEVQAKYDHDTFELFQLYFTHMPVAVALGGQIVVVHGGLSRERDASLETVRGLDYRRDIPPMPSGSDAGETLFFDLMWSDPQEEDGVAFGARGDDTVKWGPDVTTQFLTASGAGLLIRSHQVPSGGRGYGMHHGGKVLTVFSASNYGGVCMNTGAVVIIPASGSLSVKEHMALSLEELRRSHAQKPPPPLPAGRSSLAAAAAGISRKSVFGGGRRQSTGALPPPPGGAPVAAAPAPAAVPARSSVGWGAARKSARDGRLSAFSESAVRSRRSSLGGSLGRLLAAPALTSTDEQFTEEERAVSRAKLIEQILSSFRARICKLRPKLRKALAARHAALVSAGAARADGGLLPLSDWRTVLSSVLDLNVDWERLPTEIQQGLAPPVTSPDGADGSGLSRALYPAVWWEDSIERVQVTLQGDPSSPPPVPSGEVPLLPTGVGAHLLNVCFAQALPLRKALGGSAPAADAGAAAAPRTVPRATFIAAVKALANAVDEEGAPTVSPAELEALADAAPSQDGAILYQRFLDSLVVTDRGESATLPIVV